MEADMDTFVTTLYVKVDDTLRDTPTMCLWRPKVGIAPKLSDAELVTMAVVQALFGFTSEARLLRHARKHLGSYNKRLRKSAAQLSILIKVLGLDTELHVDDTWVIDSTRVECGRSRQTAQRSDLVGFAGYGYCASHSRYFWGPRLQLVCTLAGLPVTFALANAKADEREVARDPFEREPGLLRPGQVILADKGYASREFETFLSERGATLVRPAKSGEAPRPGARCLKPLRQLIESIDETLKGQLDLEAHGGHTQGGVITRVLQRLLAMTAAI